MRTLYSEHVAKWKDCRACYLHETRNRVCLARGQIPCDVLFVGEAPGETENIKGSPFVGLAGQMLQKRIVNPAVEGLTLCPECGGCLMDHEDSYSGLVCRNGHGYLPGEGLPIRVAFTNIICCMPVDASGEKMEPDAESIDACRPRLEEFIRIASPRIIVAVGTPAKKALQKGFCDSIVFDEKINKIDIVHPSWILRQNMLFRDVEIQKCVVILTDALMKL